ncbi:hypothetical protein GGTG_09614 [Gaeumannomyces tritici R3-111a-1]|uniref:Glycosyltransferase 2-like domain-containing protein n=1 Tax=Gaeumannomyces tritici (strain R3-111a-1) TaxID=644352 RepID=J3P7X4_GAET3|nr:hypothetical protein GGTG_09614 [Gaeumannomyces tritici R3-111a-1]EJT72757.1 hypothetical protein GGTG_09614 [Gaeumannomyces tritici R3-111a-1]
MALFAWASRRAGGLLLIGLILLSYYVVSHEAVRAQHAYKYQQQDNVKAEPLLTEGAGIWTSIWAYYCLLIHVLVFSFSSRINWSLWDITRGVRKVSHNKALKDFKFAHRRRGSATSLSSSETLTSSRASSTSCSEAGDLDIEFCTDGDVAPDHVIHAIIIPNYKEEVDTLRETLEVLASHPQARNCYDVYLAMEQREANVELKAMGLVQEFVKKFRSIDFTIHPSDIPGEAAGKGSNVDWAARKLSERYPLSARKDVLVTGIDADSHLSSNYFALATSMHISNPETATTTMYTAPIIFDRNAHNVPALVRVADILWAAGGISGLYTGSTIAPPTSVYTCNMELVDRVGGWDVDNEAIGEDLHMYLKCFFALNGHVTTKVIMAPVSQTNVTGGGHGQGLSGLYKDIRARYKQAERHMWGALDTGYGLRKCVELFKERKYLARAFKPLHTSLDTADSYVPQEVDKLDPEQPLEAGIFSDVTHDTLEKPDWERTFYLLHRLFEAHCLPVHATILIVSSTLFLWLTEGAADIHGIAWIFPVCNWLRTAGFMQVALYLFLYESFHRTCVETREKEMSDAGLAKGMNFSKREVKRNYIDYFLVPLVAPIFGSIPCMWAQICHFWTLDLVYTVSMKATRQRAKSIALAAKV